MGLRTVTRMEPVSQKPFCTVDDWLEGKRAQDGAEGLWRVHDDLYDFTVWMRNHPGGSYWLQITRGTDITEAFECSHISETAENILPKFFIRKAKTPRNSLITFREDGFFRTLKRKTKILADGLALAVFAAGLAGAVRGYGWALFSGILLGMLTICAHNFFHMKDNWRMYYFGLSLMSLKEWRVSHVLSHHLFPNTRLDLEVAMFEPVFQFLPSEDKFTVFFLPWLLSPFVFLLLFHVQFVRRLLDVVLSKKLQFGAEELVGLLLPIFLALASGRGLWVAFLTWNLIIVSGSFTFALIGLTAAHHHPEIYHEGDFLGHDKDFGLLQLAAVRNRVEVDGSFVLTMVMFGEHALHHIFPTVDHGMLPFLDDLLQETCKEFGIDFRPLTVSDLTAGMFRQLLRKYRNSRLMILKSD